MMDRFKNIWSGYFKNRAFGKGVMVVVLSLFFIIGYNLTTVTQQACFAQNTITDTSVTVTTSNCVSSQCVPYPTNIVPCIFVGQTAIFSNIIWQLLKRGLERNSENYEEWMYEQIDGVVESFLWRIHDIEMNMVRWWQHVWQYELKPTMRFFTQQINVSIADQSATIGKLMDARAATGGGGSGGLSGSANGGSSLGWARNEMEDRRTFNVDDSACPTATASGGLSRSSQISRSMRRAWQTEAAAAGSNKVGSVGARGVAQYKAEKNSAFEEYFCDPNDNGGSNNCAAGDPRFYNADTSVTKTLYNNLTIPVDDPADGAAYTAAVNQVIENISGSPEADVIPQTALEQPQGKEQMLNRRSWMARHGAIASVPRMIASWRMPGAGQAVGEWIKELRRGNGPIPILPDIELSDNPSYREILHALTIDRFTAGDYANSKMTQQSNIEAEKLTLNTFYLMMLRDYYELLERTALSLAVQVSVMADQEGTVQQAKRQ